MVIEPTLNIDQIAKNLKDKFVRGPVMS